MDDDREFTESPLRQKVSLALGLLFLVGFAVLIIYGPFGDEQPVPYPVGYKP